MLLSVPRDNGLVPRETGCPLSPNLIIMQFRHSVPLSLWSVNMNRVLFYVLVRRVSNVILEIMKIIRPLNSEWVAQFSDMNFQTSSTNCNVVNPSEYIPLKFHRLTINCVQSSVLCVMNS